VCDSIAVNTFFYHLPRSMFHCKDIYGNADPLPAQKSSKHLDLVISSLQQLPSDTADFYARGFIERLSRQVLLKPISATELEILGSQAVNPEI
jgi:tRNA wybutosine-synthesizing protein 3